MAYTLDDPNAGKKVACARRKTVFRLSGGNPARTVGVEEPEQRTPPQRTSGEIRPYHRPADDWDDDWEEDRPRRRRRRSRRDYDDDYGDERRGFRCPYCGSRAAPYFQSKISAAGWVTFALMLLFCLPLFWIGLLITEQHRVCADCGIKLG